MAAIHFVYDGRERKGSSGGFRRKALTIGLNRRNDWMDRLISAGDSAEQGQHPSWGGPFEKRMPQLREYSY
ncbi:hypothetical protein BO85DRAFT_453398 [Aspergillus piperis CBS 112811]|uniref:Uncharacterized protein n=1 Tax=Aspergillus piperis CBS 112811 TaxID=1448313 RepID=A0A8G1VHE9_9EURO|nr:hypothetical protein BO85DRAFT_453398 [Aspergillus piperis CBS 112811]RAH53299.1 hypothetical protein BO85DRAFT_453398 [Aspergillus piperis CBS 112811]